MTRAFRMLFLVILLSVAGTAVAQQVQTYKVKKKETIYGIARDHGISVEQLMQANEGMSAPDYKLKKGSVIYIPVATTADTPATAVEAQPSDTRGTDAQDKGDVRQREIRLGVMLPLHKVNNDGRRMVEYYRGVLMACDSLRSEGISVDVHAWNVAEDGDISAVLGDPSAARCDIIIGPLYSKQVKALSDFVSQHGIMLLIPFSINAPEIYTNPHVFQVYQSPAELSETTARRCVEWFKDSHTVIVDCADSASTKGAFTASVRKQLETRGEQYSLTSLRSSNADFAKAFVKDRPNLVILNTARSPELLSAFGRLSAVKAANPDIQLSMFGYTEWMMYTEHQTENFHRYNVYIPSVFHTNLSSAATERFVRKYRWNFHQDMMKALPRFAITGFDQAMFFLRGLHKYGSAFDGASGRFGYQPVQTPLKFERVGVHGGFANRAFMFIHYKPDHTVEAINY